MFPGQRRCPAQGALEAQGDGVQTTLLSIAIALILALVAALVGPHFVDWNRYRAEFEIQASRITGLTVIINGAVQPTDSRALDLAKRYNSRDAYPPAYKHD